MEKSAEAPPCGAVRHAATSGSPHFGSLCHGAVYSPPCGFCSSLPRFSSFMPSARRDDLSSRTLRYQGKVKRGGVTIVDPNSSQPSGMPQGAFYVDDGVARVYFSTGQLQEIDEKSFLRRRHPFPALHHHGKHRIVGRRSGPCLKPATGMRMGTLQSAFARRERPDSASCNTYRS